ncbi:MAG: CoB--CoM heterodisulfide reductase iron-sulfur subunit B family protein [Thermoanaerobacterales bacterium]|nr:CoB--CoM heterodisulfide reductase iron-sulfur subunit B family protein [Bacillota bacterium]MDI6905938.1 CoB--CoM heterodisulfide reductase iron-sulfur subunit B family protein [Thermoanaerobacterales bacterium]
MAYSFYPGCSMEATGKAYLVSLEAVSHALGLELKEIPDWNCCGATVSANAIGDLPQLAMTARNLALAEPAGNDIVVGCSSCYLNMAWANEKFKTDARFRSQVSEALGAAGLKYEGGLRVRHLIDVLVNDIGLDNLKARTIKPLAGMKIACYSGCQTVRAIRRRDFDNVEYPVMLSRIVEALGATPVPFPAAARCCGGSQQFTRVELIHELTGYVLETAAKNGAEAIVTPCPMCHMNTDVYQAEINRVKGTNYYLPVFFLTQLIGLAFDLKPKDLGFSFNVVSPDKLFAKHNIKN